MTENDKKWISEHNKRTMKEYKKVIDMEYRSRMGMEKTNRLVDMLEPSRKSRNKVIRKLKQLSLVIGPSVDSKSLHEDWDFVSTLLECVQKDGAVPTTLELKQCNKLWRKYNV
tara:strand:- start:523 stop:861 length:339 start_codon:yes stop_codon:yes gene_type:complete